MINGMAKRLTVSLPTIHCNFPGFAQLINLEQETISFSYATLVVDLRSCHFIDANMCAPLGALLYRISRRLNSIQIVNLSPDIEAILSKNGFLSHYGGLKRLDQWGTTIQYNRFERKDDRYFGAYIERHFKGKSIPDMSSALQKKFWESIFELFSNAVIHSETEMGIFTCGQFFPRKERLDFSIADLGIGMKNNLENKRKLFLSAEQAINWAMEGQNTTKTGPIPGGLGLKLLREFIRLNHGRVQVVSDRGYWEQCPDGSVSTRLFTHPFPGTVVNVEINTADRNTYALSSEIRADSIF